MTVRDGILRLAITRTRGRWTCAEIQSVQSFGYGRYTFVVNSDLAHLDPWVVLGLFTYADDRSRAHNEIDIEVAKWGQRRDPTNAQFVLQPYRLRGHTQRITLPPRPPYTMWFDWTPGRISWGITDATGALRESELTPDGFHARGRAGAPQSLAGRGPSAGRAHGRRDRELHTRRRRSRSAGAGSRRP